MTSFNFRFDQDPRRSREEKDVFFFKENQEHDMSSAESTPYFSSMNFSTQQQEEFHRKNYGHEPRLGALSPIGHPQQFSQLRSYPTKPQNDIQSLSFWHNEKVTEEDIETTPSPLKLVIAMTGLVIIGSIAWFAYKWIKGPTINNSLVIKAEAGPYKVKPENSGGINIPHQDKLIYGMISNDSDQSKVEHFLPPEEQVVDFDEQAPMYDPSIQQNSKAYNSQAPQNNYNYQQNQSYQQENPDGALQGNQLPDSRQSQANGERQEYVIQPPSYNNENHRAYRVNNNYQITQNPPAINGTSVQQNLNSVTPSSSTTESKSNFYVQLVTVASESYALEEWSRLSRKHNLGGYDHLIKATDLGNGKKNYLLLMGPFSSKENAKEQANKIKEAQVVQITP